MWRGEGREERREERRGKDRRAAELEKCRAMWTGAERRREV